MDVLKLVTDKLSQYNLLTNILPGTVLCIVLAYCIGYNTLITDNLYLQVVVFYFAGIVTNRFGSLIVEPFLKKIRILEFVPYKDYVKAEKADDKIEILSTENNVFRSYTSLCVLAILALTFRIIEDNTEWLKNCDSEYKMMALFVLLLAIFLFSYRKQTSYVNKRINKVLEENKEQV